MDQIDDENPLGQNMNIQSMTPGVIPQKVVLDWTLVKQRQENADNKAIAPHCYYGGNKDTSHDVNQGDPVFVLKCVRNPESNEGEPNLMGFVGLSGEDTSQYSSQRSMEDQYMCIGIAVTEYRVSNPQDKMNSDDPDHGFTVTIAGVANALNNGPRLIFSMQLVGWRFPPSPLSTYAPVNGLDNRFDNPINKRARQGTQPTQSRPELVPFDYTDFTMHISGGVAACSYPKTTYLGISDMPFSDFFKYDGISEAPSYSCSQEEAAGYKFGYSGVVLAGLEVLAQKGFVTINAANFAAPAIADDTEKTAIAKDLIDLSTAIGLWNVDPNPAVQPIFVEMLENMFFQDLPVNGNAAKRRDDFQEFSCEKVKLATIAAKQNYKNDPKLNYQKLRLNLSRYTATCLVGGWYSKTSKILGRALKTAAPSDTMPMVLGHTIV